MAWALNQSLAKGLIWLGLVKSIDVALMLDTKDCIVNGSSLQI